MSILYGGEEEVWLGVCVERVYFLGLVCVSFCREVECVCHGLESVLIIPPPGIGSVMVMLLKTSCSLGRRMHP